MVEILRALKICGPIIIIAISILLPYRGQVPRSYQFMPYPIKALPGTNGDEGFSYPPGIVQSVPPHKITNSALNLTREDLGWSGDYIETPLNASWQVVGVVENSTHPAIVAANFSKGHIAYVTNQLVVYPRLVYNVLAWHFGHLPNETINIALMIDSTNPPEQNLTSWYDCFGTAQKIGRTQFRLANLTFNVEEIHQFDLNNQTLRRYAVLVFAVGWGDGYYAGDVFGYNIGGWNWDSHHRDSAIMNFAKTGGLLLLPEAGFVNDYGIPIGDDYVVLPIRSLEDVLSSQTNSFAMAALSLTAIGVIYTTRSNRNSKSFVKTNIWLVGYLFGSTILWIIMPMFGGLLLPQIAVLLMALLTDLAGALILIGKIFRR
jgi:hypothetical protein